MPIPKYYVRPDGLHESIITVNGKRKAFRGKTDREVWNKIKAYRAEAEKPKTVPFSDVAHAWWNEIEPTLAPNSLRNYSPAYERAVAQFGPEDVATITSKEIETYINQFAKTHAKKTVITQRQIIRQILNKAQREGHVSFNAAQAVLLPKNLPQKRRHAPPAASCHGSRCESALSTAAAVPTIRRISSCLPRSMRRPMRWLPISPGPRLRQAVPCTMPPSS